MNTIPKFLEQGQHEPKISTKEYWTRFEFAMLLHPSKIQVDKLLKKQADNAQTLTDEEKLSLEICKATFIMAVGDQTTKEMQARNPKEEVLRKDLAWLKEKWMEIWKKSDVQNLNFVRIMQAKKGKFGDNAPILDENGKNRARL